MTNGDLSLKMFFWKFQWSTKQCFQKVNSAFQNLNCHLLELSATLVVISIWTNGKKERKERSSSTILKSLEPLGQSCPFIKTLETEYNIWIQKIVQPRMEYVLKFLMLAVFEVKIDGTWRKFDCSAQLIWWVMNFANPLVKPKYLYQDTKNSEPNQKLSSMKADDCFLCLPFLCVFPSFFSAIREMK